MATARAEPPLLATKLFVPPPRPNRVSRARLRDQLESARGGTVTLAAAGAGSGKSTLLADWALSAGKRVAWLSLDAADDEPSRFLNYLIAALKNAGTIPSMDAFASLGSASPAAIEAVLTEVLNAIAERQSETALVLDDYHVIENESVHRLVQRIIDRIPPNLHLVILSRVDPPLALARLRARDMLLEIRGNDLRFTGDEARRFLNDAMGLGLTAEQVGELEARTEGWAVGLQMAAISLRGRRGVKDFISSFSGSNRYVLDYLTDEVLHRQTDDVRAFLLETSILTQLAAPLCDAVTGRSDSGDVLRLLDAANLFLIPLDDVRFWYRYHHLFGSLLQHELERSRAAEEIAERHRRAAAWYLANAMPEPALRHAVAAGDDARAAAIVSEHAPTRIIAGDGATVTRWIGQLPRAQVDNDIDLLILHARALTSEYALDKAADEITRAERLLTTANRDRHGPVLLSLRGMLEGLRGDLERSIETLERAMARFDENDFWFSMTALHLGIAALMLSDLRKAELHLGRATGRREVDGPLTAVIGQCYGGLCHLWRGDGDQATRMAHEANEWIDAWDAKHATGRPLASLTYCLLSDAERMRNSLDEARDFALRALEFGKQGFLIGYVEASRALAQVAEAQGDWEVALTAAKEASLGAMWVETQDSLTLARALEYSVRWRRWQVTANREDLESVTQWCRESELLDVQQWRRRMQPGLCPDYSLMIGARVLLQQERYDEARQLLDALFAEAVRGERVPGQISALILRSLAEAAMGRAETAVESMQRALDVAARPRFTRFFLDEGSAVLPLLERAAPRAANRDFALRVLSAFDVPVKLRPAVAGVEESLSEREIEVLRLIAAGASNEAAARKLFVAPSTVKKHLQNIYAKLGVGGRTQAVARARELQIL